MKRPKFLPCWCADPEILDPREVSGVDAIGEENRVLHLPTTPLSGKEEDVKYTCLECGSVRFDPDEPREIPGQIQCNDYYPKEDQQ
jgi:hypothetical protein